MAKIVLLWLSPWWIVTKIAWHVIAGTGSDEFVRRGDDDNAAATAAADDDDDDDGDDNDDDDFDRATMSITFLAANKWANMSISLFMVHGKNA